MDQIKKVYNTLTRSSNTSLPLVTLILERKFIIDIYLVFEPSQYFSRKKLERTEDFLNFKWGNTDKQNACQYFSIFLAQLIWWMAYFHTKLIFSVLMPLLAVANFSDCEHCAFFIYYTMEVFCLVRSSKTEFLNF